MNKAREIGKISNRLADLMIRGASKEEIMPLVARSMEIMDESKKNEKK
jgi:hypothetical protein